MSITFKVKDIKEEVVKLEQFSCDSFLKEYYEMQILTPREFYSKKVSGLYGSKVEPNELMKLLNEADSESLEYEIKRNESINCLVNDSKIINSSLKLNNDGTCVDQLKFDKPNSFIFTCWEAYNNHYHLEIRPDDIFMAIMVQFSFYVNKHSESFRDRLVDFQGKQEIQVETNEPILQAQHDKLTLELINKMKLHIKDPSIASWAIPNFTTTTQSDKVAYSAVLLSTMKSFFSYTCRTKCGLPSVTLLGTIEDWINIKERLQKLKEFNLDDNLMDKWVRLLKPVIDQFILAASGNPNLDWWNSMIDYQQRSGGDRITGWLVCFNCFDSHGNWILNKNNQKRPTILTNDIANGYVNVPILLIDGDGTQYKSTLFSGHITASKTSDETKVKPSIDWFLLLDPPNDVTSITKKINQHLLPLFKKTKSNINFEKDLNENEKNIINYLKQVLKFHNREDIELRVAGGWVRDKLLNYKNEKLDLDFAINKFIIRAFRILRFATKFNFKIDSSLYQHIKTINNNIIKKVSKERIYQEFHLVMSIRKYSEQYFSYLLDTGIINSIFILNDYISPSQQQGIWNDSLEYIKSFIPVTEFFNVKRNIRVVPFSKYKWFIELATSSNLPKDVYVQFNKIPPLTQPETIDFVVENHEFYQLYQNNNSVDLSDSFKTLENVTYFINKLESVNPSLKDKLIKPSIYSKPFFRALSTADIPSLIYLESLITTSPPELDNKSNDIGSTVAKSSKLYMVYENGNICSKDNLNLLLEYLNERGFRLLFSETLYYHYMEDLFYHSTETIPPYNKIEICLELELDHDISRGNNYNNPESIASSSTQLNEDRELYLSAISRQLIIELIRDYKFDSIKYLSGYSSQLFKGIGEVEFVLCFAVGHIEMFEFLAQNYLGPNYKIDKKSIKTAISNYKPFIILYFLDRIPNKEFVIKLFKDHQDFRYLNLIN